MSEERRKGSIQLHAGSARVDVRTEDVYFAFPDGHLDYDCQSCGATCCRGHGYLVQIGRELNAQLRAHPASRMFMVDASDRGPRAFQMKNCPPGCFFLQEDLRCRIHAEHGYGAKPETCRLFPFNHVRRVGSTLIVRPHPSLCPLAVTPPGTRSERSSHAELLASFAQFGLAAIVPQAYPRRADVDALLAVERAIVAGADDALGLDRYLPYAASQLTIGRAGAATTPLPDALAELEQHLVCMGRLLGALPGMESLGDRVAIRSLVAATPTIRAALLFPDAPATGNPTPKEIDFDQVARMLSGLSVLVAFAHEAGMERVTYQTVLRIFTDHAPLLLLLAMADRSVAWRDDVSIELQFDGPAPAKRRYVEIARALLPAVQAERRAPLHDVINANAFEDPFENLMFVRRFARAAAGKLTTMESSASRESKFSIRRISERWALRYAPVDVLAQLASRRGANAGSDAAEGHEKSAT
ncbi:MAG: YkgJ family cysteine cluster protein [Gemmatimonadaceae bacterium]|nr:YkgJ family cysteine cluster protein [Gemmatimonadaceae bacterium]